MAAAAEGSLEVVQGLLQAGADASHCNEEGTTVLMEALGYIDVMEALVIRCHMPRPAHKV